METGKTATQCSRVLAVCVLGLLVANRLAVTAGDFDLWGYLSFGRLYWRTGAFPYEDVFAFVPTLHPWVYHEWLTGVLYYPILQGCGPAGLQVLRYALALATCLAVYATARVRRATPTTGVLYSFVAGELLLAGFAPARAQMFTYAFFAVFLWLLESNKQQQRSRLLWLPPLLLLWANLHGGFLAGLGLVGLYAVGAAVSRRRVRPLVVCGLACAAVTLVNPYGVRYWTYLLTAVAMPRPAIAEWTSVWQALFLEDLVKNAVLFLGLCLFAGLVLARRRHRDVTDLLVLAVTACLGLRHLRHQVFFFIAFAALLPSVFEADSRGEAGRLVTGLFRSRLTAAVLGLLALVLTVRLVAARPWHITAPDCDVVGNRTFSYPLTAMDILRRDFRHGTILPDFNWGEWLSWHLAPDFTVAMDGRYETVYPGGYAEAYFAFLDGRPGWRKFLERWRPDCVLLSPTSGVSGLLAAEPGWTLRHRGAGSLLFVRDAGPR